jgi:hypothetical protein
MQKINMHVNTELPLGESFEYLLPWRAVIYVISSECRVWYSAFSDLDKWRR